MFKKNGFIASLISLLCMSCSINNDDDIKLIALGTLSETKETSTEIMNAKTPIVSGNTMLISPDGSAVTFTCNAEGVEDGTLSYQWYTRGDETSTNGSAIEGATSAVYTTSELTKGIHYYYCTVTNTITDNGDGGKKTAAGTLGFTVAYTGLPVLYLDTEIETELITKESYTHGIMKIISEEYGDFEYTFSKEKEGIKGRGNSSWAFPKKGYNIKFDKKQTLFNLPKSKKWCIVANYRDKTLIRNNLSSVLGTKVFNSEWNASFIYVDLVMNGEYMGNYIFCEKITLDENRVDIQDISDYGKSKYSDINQDGTVDLNDGGFILEVDVRKDADFYFTSTQGVVFTLKDPDEVSMEIQDHIQNIVQQTEDILYGENFKDENLGWKKYLDIDSFIDWFLVNEFSKYHDSSFQTSVYLFYDPNDGKIHMGPNWDFDLGFGNSGDYYTDYKYDGWLIKNAKWISRLFEDELFVQNVKQRWNEKKFELFYYMNTSVWNLYNDIQISANYNFLRWNILGTNIDNYSPPGYENRTSYQSEVDYLIDWCNKRYQWLDTAINDL